MELNLDVKRWLYHVRLYWHNRLTRHCMDIDLQTCLTWTPYMPVCACYFTASMYDLVVSTSEDTKKQQNPTYIYIYPPILPGTLNSASVAVFWKLLYGNKFEALISGFSFFTQWHAQFGIRYFYSNSTLILEWEVENVEFSGQISRNLITHAFWWR